MIDQPTLPRKRTLRRSAQLEIVDILMQATRQSTGYQLERMLAWEITKVAGGRRGGLLGEPKPIPEAVYNTRGARRGRGPLTKTRIKREIRFR